MVVGEIPSGAQPPTGCFTELTGSQGPRSSLTLEDSGDKRLL